jgi:hypothetical protein
VNVSIPRIVKADPNWSPKGWPADYKDQAYGLEKMMKDIKAGKKAAVEGLGKLKDEQQKTILSSCGVQPIGQVKVGTEQELLDSLEHMNLGDWGILKDALPQRFQNAMTQAAKLLVPKARKVALHGATINNEQEADEWLAQAKKTILDNLKDGPVIV